MAWADCQLSLTYSWVRGIDDLLLKLGNWGPRTWITPLVRTPKACQLASGSPVPPQPPESVLAASRGGLIR